MKAFEMNRPILAGLALSSLALLLFSCQPDLSDTQITDSISPSRPTGVRVALFNIRELKTVKITQLNHQGVGVEPQARAAANIIQKIRPDILVINEIDHDYNHLDEGYALTARLFSKNYLQSGGDPIDYPYAYAAPNNTGLLTGLDLNRDGQVSTDSHRGERSHGDDCYGWGRYPGEFSMAVLSMYPITTGEARTFQKMLWRDLPGNHIPPDYYSAESLDILRLSSKSHWDLPIQVGSSKWHLLLSHPTPQGFDGDEDRNGRRNFDEIMFWAHYLDGSEAIYDDRGEKGGYSGSDPFVIAGDLNARPARPSDLRAKPSWTLPSIYDGKAAIAQLLEHPSVQDSGSWLTSGRSLGALRPGAPDFPERASASFGDGARIDYLLPSAGLQILGGGVYWPNETEDPEGAAWAEEASDHRLVWIDLVDPES